MKIKIIMTLVLVSAIRLTALAQLSTLTLTDGSVLRGYIAVQKPGEYVTFHTVDADVYMDEADVTIGEAKYIPLASLSKGWQKRAKQDGLSGLRLCTVSNGDEAHPMALVKERGATIRYEQHCTDTYSMYWSDIQKITRDDADLSTQPLLDQLSTYDGTTYTGIVVEQRPGQSTKIKLRNGDVRVIEQDDIRSSRKIARTVDADLWAVRPYTNTVVLEDGSEHTGVIVCQSTGDTAADSYVELYKPDGTQERISFIDIEEYRNEPCHPLEETE